MDAISVLANRTMSAFPLSIGTSLAFESLFTGRQDPYDPNRELPPKVSLGPYGLFMINVETLLRNIIYSVPTQDSERLGPQALVTTLKEEINMINDIMLNEGMGIVKLYFYVRNYTLVKQSFKRAHIVRFREAHTEKQLIYQTQVTDTIKLLKKDPAFNYVIYDMGLNFYPKTTMSALIFTHVPYDLLVYSSFNKMDLLESHTGILKSKKDFWTKYYSAKELDLSHIPFQRKLLGFFGDHVLFKPVDIKIRKAIMHLAVTCKWTSVTHSAKVKNDIDHRLADLGIKREYDLM